MRSADGQTLAAIEAQNIPGLPDVVLARAPLAASHELSRALHADESRFATTLSVVQQPAFIAGRAALRVALQGVLQGVLDGVLEGMPPSRADETLHAVLRAPLLRNERGAPVVPAGALGSISHKRDVAVAVAARSRILGGAADAVGVDIESLEHATKTSRDISRRIMTDRELRQLSEPGTSARRLDTLVTFALKEAVYKAIDPVVRRYVKFTEVELSLQRSDSSGSAEVHFLLPELREHAPVMTTRWWVDDARVYAVASSRWEASRHTT